MDEEKARQKEARRTLNRIRSTLSKLKEDSAAEDALEESEEYRRMKDLLEHGYAKNKPEPFEKFLILIKHPLLLVFLILVVLTLLID